MKLIGFISELLFPKRCVFCDRVIGFTKCCASCDKEMLKITNDFNEQLDDKSKDLSYINKAYAMYLYEEPLRSAILQMKFNSRAEKAVSFGELLGEQINACKNMEDFDIIIPVPSTNKAIRKRGYDIPLLIAKAVSNKTLKPVCKKNLVKIFDTQKQSSLSGIKRRANLAGVFLVNNPEQLYGKSVLLIDDIVTTGTTLNECAKMLRYAQVKTIIAACIAQTSQEQAKDGK